MSAATKEDAGAVSWHEKLLRELIYERVMLHLDLVDLIDFERQLAESIERAMHSAGLPVDQRDARARQYLDEAWERAERDWERLRAEPDDGDCPLCDGPLGNVGARGEWQAAG